jgi:hypothetical protein
LPANPTLPVPVGGGGAGAAPRRSPFGLSWAAPALILEAAILGIAVAGDLRARPGRYLILHFVAFAAFLLAVRGARSLPSGRAGFLRVLGVAVVLRATLLPVAPSLSDDVYRYLWDARVQRAGINPYLFAPDDPALASLRDETWAPINHKEIPTIYPPLMQAVFRGVAAVAASILALKVAFCVVDLGVVGILWWLLQAEEGAPRRIALYAWNPLVVVEVAASGHNDVVAAALVLLALAAIIRGRPRLSTAAWGAAIAAKLWPVVLAPALARRTGPRRLWPAAAVLVALYLPFADAGRRLFAGLSEYGARWQHNDFLFGGILQAAGWLAPAESLRRGITWVRGLLGGTERLEFLYYLTDAQHVARAAALLLLGTVLGLSARGRRPDRAFLAAILGLLLLSPTVHPWYLLWAAPLLPVEPSLGLLAWTGLAPLSYAGPALAGSAGPLVPWAEYAPVLALLAVDLARRRRDPGPASPSGVE